MSKHYTDGYGCKLEVIEYLKDKLTPEQFEGFCIGNILKYTSRANFRGEYKKDLTKAAHYGRILEEYMEATGTKQLTLPIKDPPPAPFHYTDTGARDNSY